LPLFDLQQKQKKTGSATLSCPSCGLYKQCLSPRMSPYGDGKRAILNIGEAPGEDEDRRGKPWQGKVGRALRKTYRRLGVDLFEDCYNVNAINCRPPQNRDPTRHELNCCREVKVKPAINHFQPQVIVLLGNQAVQSVIGERWTRDLGGITRWRGWTIPDRDLNAWVCPVFHPSYVERYGDEEAWTIWRQDLQRAINCLDRPLPAFEDERKNVTIVRRERELVRLLKKARKADRIAFDYETTGLKPHAAGHEIVCASFAMDEEQAYAFRMPEKGSRGWKLWAELMADPTVSKMAHNMKFEEMWTQVIFGTPVVGWEFDSMLAAHILDNRKHVASLKFQAYVQFGIVDYSSAIEPWLKGDEQQGANSFNYLHRLISRYGDEELLIYNGIDSLLEFRLAMQQMDEIGGP